MRIEQLMLTCKELPMVIAREATQAWWRPLVGALAAAWVFSIQWKDYAHGHRWRTMTLTAMEFLRRFVQHVLPRGFVRIRQFGYLANTGRTAHLALARRLLQRASPPSKTPSTAPAWHCPRCGAPMVLGPILSALKLATVTLGFDTS